jgi:drug/metabolite transporter (DMT)-like permease
LSNYLGELAALATAVCWVLTAISFTIAGRQAGSVVVNRLRLILAVLFLSLTHLLVKGQWLVTGAEPDRWFWLGLSGIVGLVIGDGFLLQALVWIGPRLPMLMMSLVPIISAALGWVFLGERLSAVEMLAIGLTVGAVAMVVTDKKDSNGLQVEPRRYWLGILMGLGGALGQAVGLIMSKWGMMGDFDPLSATLIRMIVAAAVMWSVALFRGQAGATLRALNDRRASLAILAGAIAGPFVGVWLSLVAVKLTRVGIASTLMALTPVFILVPSHFLFKERVSLRGILGTAAAVAGVVIILLA